MSKRAVSSAITWSTNHTTRYASMLINVSITFSHASQCHLVWS